MILSKLLLTSIVIFILLNSITLAQTPTVTPSPFQVNHCYSWSDSNTKPYKFFPSTYIDATKCGNRVLVTVGFSAEYVLSMDYWFYFLDRNYIPVVDDPDLPWLWTSVYSPYNYQWITNTFGITNTGTVIYEFDIPINKWWGSTSKFSFQNGDNWYYQDETECIFYNHQIRFPFVMRDR